MIDRKQLTSAIDTAIGCLPKELCRLTTDYLDERPHTFNNNEIVTANRRPWPINVVVTDIESPKDDDPYPWRTLVSLEPFESGHLQWTAEFPIRTGQSWLGVGVTRSLANRPADLQKVDLEDVALTDDWILLSKSDGMFYVAHNGQLTEAFDDVDVGIEYGPVRVEFDADPSTGSVTADVYRSVDWIGSVTLISGVDDLLTFRPSVVVAGRTHVVVRSGPST